MEENEMTKEEALKQIREWDFLNDEERAALETLIPELRESEDERIRKNLIRFLRGEIHEIDVEEAVAYLERLKENPKSADSIPSDCVSDAKCENRWHKVGDSLPDNPREVLCKDEAGDYFIGRYYVGEGWEISNYDDEDKPHHLNPPVSKWIDFPSEKQKESLRDFIDNFPYSDEQKEQKPVEWSDTNELVFNDICKHLENEGYSGWVVLLNALRNGEFQFKQEWSKEDEDFINMLILHFNYLINKGGDSVETYKSYIEKLKSIRPHWKPSEEQIAALDKAICNPNLGVTDKMLLDDLLEILKKLM